MPQPVWQQNKINMSTQNTAKTLAIIQQALSLVGGILTGFGISSSSTIFIVIGLAASVIGTVWAIISKQANESYIVSAITHVAQTVSGIFVADGKITAMKAQQIIAAVVSGATFVLNYIFNNNTPTTPTT